MVKHPVPSPSSPASKKPRPPDPSSPAGFIFMCSGETMSECYRHRVFGMPKGRLEEVSRVRRGAWLFLYDFDTKHLYGPYRADSDGGRDLVPAAFSSRFPAQVKFKIDGDFLPIPESSLKTAIQENYSNGKFSPELTSKQVNNLRALFQPIVLLPESVPLQYVDDRRPTSASYLPPTACHPTQAAAYVPPPATHFALPAGYPPPPAAHFAPPAAYASHPAIHLVRPAAYAPPSYHVPPPTAHLTTPASYVNTPGDLYQSGYSMHALLPAAAHYVQAPPCDPYVQYQHLPPMTNPQHVPSPDVYSTDPYYAPHRNDPYRLDALKYQYQQSTVASGRTAYGAAVEAAVTNLQPVRHYGSTPSRATEAHEAAATNFQLVRHYGSVPSNGVELYSQGNYQVGPAASVHGAVSTIYPYAGCPTAFQIKNAPTSSAPPAHE